LVLVAVWFAALAPAAAQLLVKAGAPAWVQVCSAQGMRWVEVQASGAATTPDDGSGGAVTHDHCPFCQLNQQGAAPPPPDATAVLAAAPATVMPTRFLSAATTAHAWRTAQPRAPPLLA
jgi:hypothetical protein